MMKKGNFCGGLERALLALALSSSGASAYGAGAAELRLTEKGAPKAVIIKPAGTNQVIGFAAEELQKYVGKISGAKMPIRAADGGTDGAAVILRTAALDPMRGGLPCDSFTVRREGDRLLLTGNTERGVLYAVYAFLEGLGCAWPEPGEAGEILPRLPTVAVGNLDLASKPGFDLRGIVLYDEGGGREAVDWMGKMRLNLIMHPNSKTQADCVRRGLLVMEGTSHDFGERLGLNYGFDKTQAGYYGWFKDQTNYYKYMAMVGGKREPLNKGNPGDTDFCMSNAEGVDLLIAHALRFIEDYRPEVYIFDARADDRKDNWCECEACSRQSQTDNHLAYINKLAKAVYARWPEKKVSLIAYLDTMSPPKSVTPDLSMGNMILWFAPITRTYRQSAFSATTEKTPLDYPRNKERWPAADGAWQPFLRAWRDAFKGPILVLDYYHWSWQAESRPSYFYMRPEVIAEDLKGYKKLGFSGSIGVEHVPLKLPNAWNSYLKARLLWDPSAEVAGLERAYNSLFYGECAEAAEKCLHAVADTFNAEREDDESVRQVREAGALFRAATAACPKTPAVQERLDRLALFVTYAALRKESFLQKKIKSPDGQKKAAAELSAFVSSNKAKINPHYGNFKSMQECR